MTIGDSMVITMPASYCASLITPLNEFATALTE
jgi:hypothetical protein